MIRCPGCGAGRCSPIEMETHIFSCAAVGNTAARNAASETLWRRPPAGSDVEPASSPGERLAKARQKLTEQDERLGIPGRTVYSNEKTPHRVCPDCHWEGPHPEPASSPKQACENRP